MPPGGMGLNMKGGILQRIPPGATKEQQAAILNDVIDRLNDMLKVQTFSDAGSKRYVQGYVPGRFPDGDFGMAISAEGDDVLTIEFEKLLFAWDFSSNKQYYRGGTQKYTDKNGAKVMDIGTLDDSRTGIDWFDPGDGDNFMRAGVLPDDSGGVAVAKDGEDVKDAY